MWDHVKYRVWPGLKCPWIIWRCVLRNSSQLKKNVFLPVKNSGRLKWSDRRIIKPEYIAETDSRIESRIHLSFMKCDEAGSSTTTLYGWYFKWKISSHVRHPIKTNNKYFTSRCCVALEEWTKLLFATKKPTQTSVKTRRPRWTTVRLICNNKAKTGKDWAQYHPQSLGF